MGEVAWLAGFPIAEAVFRGGLSEGDAIAAGTVLSLTTAELRL